MSNKDKMVERVRKLLALSQNNPSQEEAQAALLHAQELMVKYNLNELDLIKDGESADAVEEIVGLRGGRRLGGWQNVLAKIIADNFRCDVYIQRSNPKYNGERVSYEAEVRFVGLSMDVNICNEVYQKALEFADMYCTYYLLMYKVERMRTLTRSESKKLSGTWRWGFVKGIEEKFKDQVKKNGWEMVLVKPGLVVQHMDKKKITKGSKLSYTRWDDNAFEDGKDKGKKFGSDHQDNQEASVSRGPRLLER